LKKGNNVSISISSESEEEARRLFEALSEGGDITMPLQKTFWAPLFAMFTDKFGISWLISLEG
jgi:PhnB protein